MSDLSFVFVGLIDELVVLIVVIVFDALFTFVNGKFPIDFEIVIPYVTSRVAGGCSAVDARLGFRAFGDVRLGEGRELPMSLS